MTKRAGAAATDWKRPARLVVLFLAGAVGLATRYAAIPRWLIALIAVSVPAVWIVTSFQMEKPGETEFDRRRRMRNIAIALALAGLVLLFYLATMVRLGGNVLNRPM